MIESTERVDEFKAEIAALRVPSPAPHRDRLFARLGLAGNTVSNHISNIFAKLQVASRAEAIVRARTAGLGG